MKKVFFICAFLLMACGHGEHDADTHSGIQIDGHDRCHMCGMMVKQYPGPKGSVLLKSVDNSPKFCSTRDMFIFALQPENKRQIESMWVHDMATTGWEEPDDAHFINAKKAWYVYGSNRKAVMGPAIAPFSSLDAAEKFVQQYGGAVFEYEQIDLSLLSESDHERKHGHMHNH